MFFDKFFRRESRFKPLPDYPGYAVSKDGEVRNIFTDHILKPLTGRSGKERKRVKLNGRFVYIDELVEQVYGKGKEKNMNEFEKYYGNESSIMEKEEFRPVVENSRYDVSNYGHVRKADSWVWLTEQLTRTGYKRVRLTFDNGRHISYAVHRLVAHAFYPMENADDFQVNHIDGNKMNNHLDNLEYVTGSENIRHAFATGLSKMTEESKKKHRDALRAFYPPVKCLENGKVYPDAHVAAKDLGLDPSTVRAVTRGERETHKGYHFENADWSEINVYDD